MLTQIPTAFLADLSLSTYTKEYASGLSQFSALLDDLFAPDVKDSESQEYL